ncbi:hypothetical protein HK096_004269 [Nowakowskiella sp. JEL0078]|nr:hypothetical protein HK096_004269 [Nowakowskiella sp. JEL0078]
MDFETARRTQVRFSEETLPTSDSSTQPLLPNSNRRRTRKSCLGVSDEKGWVLYGTILIIFVVAIFIWRLSMSVLF